MPQDLEVLEGDRTGSQVSFWHRLKSRTAEIHVSGSGRVGVLVGALLLLGVVVTIAVVAALFSGKDGAVTNTACESGYRCINGTCEEVGEGSFECECDEGFSVSPNRQGCIDIDECVNGSLCDDSRYCVNTPGSYECRCQAGYEQFNTSCVDVDECVDESPCGAGTPCCNTIGSYVCGEENCTQNYTLQQSISVTAVQACKEHQFRCNGSGECLSFRRWRDDVIDCKDGSDEPSGTASSCKPSYRACSYDQKCIHYKYYCDSVKDCTDDSDEIGCRVLTNTFDCVSLNISVSRRYKCQGSRCPDYNCECVSGQRTCSNGRCVEPEHWCDGENDCGDNSDEVSCHLSCDAGYHLCDDTCKPPEQICDRVIDCSDLSDELSCGACPEELHFQCSSGPCIQAEFQCNGIDDCLDYSDEVGCSLWVPCHGGFRCDSGSCINITRTCDGVLDCDDAEDEQQCFNLIEETADTNHSLVLVRHETSWFPFCSDKVTSATAQQICHKLGYRDLTSFISDSHHGSTTTWATIHATFQSEISLLQQLVFSDVCESGSALYLQCQQTTDVSACGIRESLEVADDSGQVAAPGVWPWVALLYAAAGGLCGASVLSRHWLLTAAHCVTPALQGTEEPFAVRLGTTQRSAALDPNQKLLHEIRDVIIYPDFSQVTVQNDVALLRTREPIQYSRDVRPICIPGSGEDYRALEECYVIGWGISNHGSRPDRLHQTRVRIQPASVCSGYLSQHAPEASDVAEETDICLSVDHGPTTFCPVDSGGPVVCRRHTDTSWVLIGLISRRPSTCLAYFWATEVSNYVNWIHLQEDSGRR